KKTMGKFISVLRKANSMTQQELADKLLVSDKTVSKWERDERMPDISLLPAIAEIFGITTDELLRGERNNPERADYNTEESEAKQKAKSDKQIKNMFDKKKRRYNSLTWVSIAITLVGLIVGFVLAECTYWVLAVPVTCIFVVVAQICQLIFATNAIIATDEEYGYPKMIGKYNGRVVAVAAWFTIVNLSVSTGLMMLFFEMVESVLGAGLILTIPLLLIVVLYTIYTLVVRKVLIKRGVILCSDENAKIIQSNTKTLKIMLIVCGVIAVVLVSVGSSFMDPINNYKKYGVHFDTADEFKAHVEGHYDSWCEDQRSDFSYVNEQGKMIFDQESYEEYCQEHKEESSFYDGKNERYEYYCLDSYAYLMCYSIDGYEISDIYMVNKENSTKVMYAEEIAREHFTGTIAVYLCVCIIVYAIVIAVNKKKVLAGAYNADKAEESVQEEIVAQ
ncbi:MAG: helix-turn-helix transcriptional regulator, partial [Clostridia bacterium]|nr:helix-turn-helix transcriptional regulator [Clostridia bacterium]